MLTTHLAAPVELLSGVGRNICGRRRWGRKGHSGVLELFSQRLAQRAIVVHRGPITEADHRVNELPRSGGLARALAASGTFGAASIKPGAFLGVLFHEQTDVFGWGSGSQRSHRRRRESAIRTREALCRCGVASTVRPPNDDVARLRSSAVGFAPTYPNGQVPFLKAAAMLSTSSVGRSADLWGRITGNEPDVNSAALAAACLPHACNSSRAESELDYQRRPLRETVEAAWSWFQEHGYA